MASKSWFRSSTRTASNVGRQWQLLLWFVVAFWVVELADQIVFAGGLDRLGILPREPLGLFGILFAPFLHGNFSHLAANTIPFCVLGWLVLLQGRPLFFRTFAYAQFLGGGMVWLFAKPGYHIGASGIVFGFFGFLVARGYYERRVLPVITSLAVIVVYGGMVWGTLPTQQSISWEGHLGGAVAGVLAARKK